MGKGSYLGGSTLWGYGASKKVGKASRFSPSMMEAYNLRTMTNAERRAYLRKKLQKKQEAKEAKEAKSKIIATKRDVQKIPALKPGQTVDACKLEQAGRRNRRK